jgi:hypothetical protein
MGASPVPPQDECGAGGRHAFRPHKICAGSSEITLGNFGQGGKADVPISAFPAGIPWPRLGIPVTSL